MIKRRLIETLRRRLAEFPAVALLGPRQVGKTTLARMLQAETRDSQISEYLDLENPADRAKLEDAVGFLRSKSDRLMIIDEVHRAPGLFQVLRGLIDDRIFKGEPAGHYLLLGSASIDLLKQASETLAGRIARIELGPLDVTEVDTSQAQDLWVRGGFPRSLLLDSDQSSSIWRENFIATYLERDIPQLGPRIPAETLRRFWTMLAHRQGSVLNAAELARSLAVDGKTVAKYLDLMVDLLLVRRLPPLHANVSKRLVKSPKCYIRDSGLVHTLLRIQTGDDLLSHPVIGASWEGHVIENLIRVAPDQTRVSFYKTAAGTGIDLILELPGNRMWAVEIKRGLAPKVGRGFYIALDDLGPDRAFIVYSGEERYSRERNVEVIGLTELAAVLSEEV